MGMLDSYALANHALYSEMYTGTPAGGWAKNQSDPVEMSSSVAVGRQWSQHSNKNHTGIDIRQDAGPNQPGTGTGMSEMAFRGVTIYQYLTETTASSNTRTYPTSGGHASLGFYYHTRGNWGINPTHHPSSTSYLLERPTQMAAFAATNERTGTYGDQAGWGVYISGSNWKSTFQGYLGVGNGANANYPTYELEVVGDVRISDSLGVGTTPNATDGHIRAADDIVSFYSDERLKEKITIGIENPIDKIKNINTFTYRHNELANTLGFEGDKIYIGVGAKSVKEVVPEAVEMAPFDVDGDGNSKSGEDYLTVQYERLVPLLIEGIKNQQTQIDELKREIEEIKNG